MTIRRQGGSKGEEKPVFRQNALPYSYLVREVRWDCGTSEDQQGTDILLTSSLQVVCAGGAPAGFLQSSRAFFRAAAAQQGSALSRYC